MQPLHSGIISIPGSLKTWTWKPSPTLPSQITENHWIVIKVGSRRLPKSTLKSIKTDIWASVCPLGVPLDPMECSVTLSGVYCLNPDSSWVPLKNHHISSLSPGPLKIKKTCSHGDQKTSKCDLNLSLRIPNSWISGKSEIIQNTMFLYGYSTCNHCTLASFPSLDHQKHGPGTCLPFCHPKSQKVTK